MSEQAYLIAKAARGEYKNSLLGAGNPEYRFQVRRGTHPYARQQGADAAGASAGGVAGGAVGGAIGYRGLVRTYNKDMVDRQSAGVADAVTRSTLGAQVKANRAMGKLHRVTGGRVGRPTMWRASPRLGKGIVGLSTPAGLAGAIGGSTVGGIAASRRSTDASIKRGDLRVIRRSDKRRATGMGVLQPKFGD